MGDGRRSANETHVRYFITFACYGGHLHGDESGSVDRRHNLAGSRMVDADATRAVVEWERMRQAPYLLDAENRAVVLVALREVCAHRGWLLLAAHVRSNHVHVVVESESPPEKVMNDFKSYASRSLNRLGGDGSDRRRWAHHGSTRWLWKDQDVREAIRYVVEGQGEPMEVFVGGCDLRGTDSLTVAAR
jgi:REP element-mobilizing transposase RayT